MHTTARHRGLWISGLVLVLCTLISAPFAPSALASPSTLASPSFHDPRIVQRVAVLLVNFAVPDAGLYPAPPEPWTAAQVRDLYFDSPHSVAAYYTEVSDGLISITGEVFGYFTLSISPRTCQSDAWGVLASQRATASGIDLSQFTNVAYVFPHQQSCWWSGWTVTGHSDSWINGELTPYVAAHEIGHTLGLDHASAFICRDSAGRVSFSANCKLDEYGDPFDVMGFTGQRHFNAWHLWQLGLIADDQIQTITADGTYGLAPVDRVGGSPRMLNIPRPGGGQYNVELRQRSGQFDDFPALSSAVNGLLIRITPVSGPGRTKLIDATPQTTSFSDASLAVGKTLSDPINRINITLLSIDGDGAQVAVDVDADPPLPDPGPSEDPDLTPPSAPTDLTAFVNAPRVATLRWREATDDVGVDHYDVYDNGAYFAITKELAITNVRAKEGELHQFTVRAVDAAGNAGEAASIDFTVPDITPPGELFGLTATVTSTTSARLNWLAADDGVGVAGYEVSRDNAVIATLPAAARSFSESGLAEYGSFIYSVAAVDAAGNHGAAGFVRVALHDSDAAPPSAPTDLAAQALGSRRVRLTWTASTDDQPDVLRYRIFRGKTRIATVTTTTFLDRAPRAQTYRYRVRAIDAAGHMGPLTPFVTVFAAK